MEFGANIVSQWVKHVSATLASCMVHPIQLPANGPGKPVHVLLHPHGYLEKLLAPSFRPASLQLSWPSGE